MPFRFVTRLDAVALGVVALVIVMIAFVTAQGNSRRAEATVAYLYPAYGGLQNVWFAPLADPTQAEQMTFAPDGLYDFAVSHDGDYLAYSQRIEPTGLHDIMLMNLNTRQITQVTNCVVDNSDCRTPVFRPTGRAIAYERLNTNTGVGTGVGVTRIWLADLSRQPYDNQPLSQDSQFVGYGPEWALDGNSLAFYSSDIANPGILVYNFNPAAGDQTLKFVPSQYGTVGALSPNGSQLIYPDLSRRPDSSVYSFLRIADLEGLDFVNFTNAEDNIDDIEAVWNPNGTSVTIVRRYTDERWTRGYQLYDVSMADQTITPLVVDAGYSHGFFSYDASGTALVMQRFPFDAESATGSNPQIWTYNLATKALEMIADNAFSPRWVYGTTAS